MGLPDKETAHTTDAGKKVARKLFSTAIFTPLTSPQRHDAGEQTPAVNKHPDWRFVLHNCALTSFASFFCLRDTPSPVGAIQHLTLCDASGRYRISQVLDHS